MLVVREAYLTSEQMEQIGIPAALDTDMDIIHIFPCLRRTIWTVPLPIISPA